MNHNIFYTIKSRIYSIFIRKYEYAFKSLKIFYSKFGYWNSLSSGKPVDWNNKPIPWYTYPAFEFLNEFNYKDKKVFEWGSGYSSIYWGNRAKNVISIEDDRKWLNKMKNSLPSNVSVIYCKKKNDYVNHIKLLKTKFDIIVIDGNHRYECANITPKFLSKGGIVILDNSDWFTSTKAKLEKNYLAVDFKGFGPGNPYTWVTSIFFTNNFKFRKISNKNANYSIGGLVQRAD